jgi:PRTRC genetic system protein C
MEVQSTRRVFRYNGADLPDPNPSASLEEVKDLLASSGMAEVQNATIHGPTYEEGREVYQLKAETGHKG